MAVLNSPPLAFDQPVPPSGYRWWYVDGVSQDGRYGVVIIAFVGSVFSPYYFSARKQGPANPEDYCSINVCLYRPGGPVSDRWAMTERSARHLDRDPGRFAVAKSRLEWLDDTLVVHVDERTTPFARKLRGTIRLRPRVLNDRRFALDAGSRHYWQPVAPLADINVDFESPSMQWQGHGYLDSNWGSRMLELDFDVWDWSRSAGDDETRIHYVANHVGGGARALSLRFGRDGSCTELAVPAEQALPRTGWRVRRSARHKDGLRVALEFEDTPFYSRSLLEDASGNLIVHESLDMRRFRSRWVQFLLPFRMPRIA